MARADDDKALHETLDLLSQVVASISDRLDSQGETLNRLAAVQAIPWERTRAMDREEARQGRWRTHPAAVIVGIPPCTRDALSRYGAAHRGPDSAHLPRHRRVLGRRHRAPPRCLHVSGGCAELGERLVKGRKDARRRAVLWDAHIPKNRLKRKALQARPGGWVLAPPGLRAAPPPWTILPAPETPPQAPGLLDTTHVRASPCEALTKAEQVMTGWTVSLSRLVQIHSRGVSVEPAQFLASGVNRPALFCS